MVTSAQEVAFQKYLDSGVQKYLDGGSALITEASMEAGFLWPHAPCVYNLSLVKHLRRIFSITCSAIFNFVHPTLCWRNGVFSKSLAICLNHRSLALLKLNQCPLTYHNSFYMSEYDILTCGKGNANKGDISTKAICKSGRHIKKNMQIRAQYPRRICKLGRQRGLLICRTYQKLRF